MASTHVGNQSERKKANEVIVLFMCFLVKLLCSLKIGDYFHNKSIGVCF